MYVYLVDLLRRRALLLGEKFKTNGQLDEVEHLFDLTVQQIDAGENDGSLDLRPWRETNMAPRRAVEHVKEWPKIIDSRGKIYRALRQAGQGDYVGDAISPGVVVGTAKVLGSPYEKPVERGEILVTRATEPSWTPIFINAAGVVLEIGGPLQHGAIIAREYGIPCVSGVEGATREIFDGDELEVDGSNGLVRVVHRAKEHKEPSGRTHASGRATERGVTREAHRDFTPAP